MLDSLGFQLPQMDVISSDPRNVFEGEAELELQRGRTDVKRIQDLQNFVGQAFGAAAKVAGPQIAQERQEKERKGYVAGLELAAGVSGTSYEERQKSLQDAFKRQRTEGEIGLIDDPYFVRGLHKAEGVSQVTMFENAATSLYEQLKGNPDFYSNPAIYEQELKRLFDSVYVSLPQNSDVQEGFLSKINPFVARINQKYVAEANEANRIRYINNQTSRVGAAIHTYEIYKDTVEADSDSDVRDKWIQFSKELIRDQEMGELSDEELQKFLPEEARITGDDRKDLQKYLRDAVADPNRIRGLLIAGEKSSLVEEVQSVFDDLHNFAGEGRGGLGVDPTDAIIEIVSKQFDSPTTAMQVVSQLRSGTGLLMNTDKGKSALNILYPKALDEVRTERSRNLQERNRAYAEQSRLRQERSRAAAELLKEEALPIALVDADINSFNQILYENQNLETGPQTPEELSALLMERLEFMKDIDPEGYARRVGKLREAVNKSRSPYSGYSDIAKRNQVAEGMASILDSMEKGADPTQTARNIMSTHNVLGTATDQAFNNFINDTFSFYQEAFTDPEVGTATRAEAERDFWNTATVINELDQMGGPSYSMAEFLNSERTTLSSPLYMNMLREAQERGLLNAFVSDTTRLGKTATLMGDSRLSPEEYAEAFKAQFEDLVEQERLALEERTYRRELGFAPDSIPFYGPNGKRELIGQRDLVSKIDRNINQVTDLDSLPAGSLQHLVKSYSEIYNGLIADGYSKEDAGREARLKFSKKYSVIDVKAGDYDGATDTYMGAIHFLVDNDKNHEATLHSLQSDEETRNRGIESFLLELQFLSDEEPLTAAQAKVSEYQDELTEQIVLNFTEREVDPFMVQPQPIFDQAAYSKVRSSLQQIEINPPRTEFETVEESLARQLNRNALIESFDTAFDLYKVSVDEQYQPVEGAEGVDLFVRNAVDSYIGKVKSGDPDVLRKVFKDIFIKADSGNATGFGTYKAETAYKSQQEREKVLRADIQRYGINNYLGYIFDDETIQNFTDASRVAENLRDTQLNFAGFDLSDPDTNIFMYPVDETNFVIANEEGTVLTYKRDGKPFTFGIADLGDAIQRQQIKTPQALWEAVGKTVNPKVNNVTREELEAELTDYFEPFPDMLPLTYFVQRFKGNGKAMYQYYKKLKG